MELAKVDWNNEWKHQMTQWRTTSGKSCKEFWADPKSAKIYLKEGVAKHQSRIDNTLKDLPLEPHMRVIDIGSGPGILAVPMAKKVRSVTTVEPSPGMNHVMQELIREKDIQNIRCIEKPWEDVEITPELNQRYDLVIASMSLGMTDIREAVEKMVRVSRGYVYIYWHAGIPGWEAMPKAVWPRIFDQEYHGGPKSDILFQVLYQMGIYPNIEVTNEHFHETFTSPSEAVEFYCKRFERIRDDHRPVLEEYLSTHLVKENGGYVHGFDHTTMKFWWKTGEESHALN
jgi:SAM-dependent methyltransferase